MTRMEKFGLVILLIGLVYVLLNGFAPDVPEADLIVPQIFASIGGAMFVLAGDSRGGLWK